MTALVRRCSCGESTALFAFHADPVDGLVCPLGSGKSPMIERPIELKYFGLMMFVCAVVPAQGLPLRPPVPAWQKKSVTPCAAYGFVNVFSVVPPTRVRSAGLLAM